MDVIRIEDVTKNGNRRVRFSYAGITFPTRKLALKVKELYDKQQIDSDRSESYDEQAQVQQNDEELYSLSTDGVVPRGGGAIDREDACTGLTKDTGTAMVHPAEGQRKVLPITATAIRSKIAEFQRSSIGIERAARRMYELNEEQGELVERAANIAGLAIAAAEHALGNGFRGSSGSVGGSDSKASSENLALKPESHGMKRIDQV